MYMTQRGIVFKKVLIVVFAVLIVIVIGAAIARKAGQTSGDATDLAYQEVGSQFVADIIGDNPVAAYNLMTADLQQERSQSSWTAALQDTFSRYDHAELIDSSKSKRQDTADTYYLKYRLSSENDKYVVQLTVSKEKGSWKVSDFITNATPNITL